ncbi:MAG TPA: hypothetical protein VHG29_13995 [Novosphingobium sp.]|nr:hypothetical protein [Novosphingobium sp.]
MASVAALIAVMVYPAPASAQDADAAALDAAIDASMTPAGAIALARSQAAAGELTEAAATLERVLIAQPRADDVRLAYTALLCRLDDRQAAQLELNALAGRAVSGSGWDEVRAACGADFARPASRSYLSGQAAIGLAYDSDALGEVLVQPTGAALSGDGLAALASARLHAHLALGRAFIYGDAGGVAKQSVSGPASEYQFGSAALGFGHALGAGEIAAGGVLRSGRINNQHYVTEYGGELRLSFPEGASGRLTLRGEAVKQDFYQPALDGWNYGVSFLYTGRPSERVAWFLAGQGEFKTAPSARNEYYAARLSGGVEVQLDERGTYAAFSTSLRYVDFGEEAFFPERKDWRFYNRAALGLPLGGTGLTLEAAATHSYRNYNAASGLDDYTSFGGELRLVWKFGPGRSAR